MREAAERAAEGAPEGAVVLAEEQTAGRGRLGRSWASERGVGLYFSVLLRPPLPPAQAAVLTLALGLGAARGLGEACGRRCDLRWPNDVLLSDKKCCGILVETAAEQNRLQYAIAGVGINVNQPEMPGDLATLATSLRIETGREFLLEAVLEGVLRQCQRYYEMFLERGTPAIVEAFSRASSYVEGREVIVENGPQRVRGITAGLDSSGALLLRHDEGRIEPVLAGSLRRWLPAAGSEP
jgi:BirA family biotin operon repressor/biotin-[acetyl-CoA-carboxylase] ligase